MELRQVGGFPLALLFCDHFSLLQHSTFGYPAVHYFAKMIGDRSSGKVVASRYFPEQIGTDRVIPFGIQISVGKVVFPNTEVLENTGVTPDVVCLPKTEDLARNADPCLEQAVSPARKAAGMQEAVPEPSKRQIEEMLQSMLRESEKAWKN